MSAGQPKALPNHLPPVPTTAIAGEPGEEDCSGVGGGARSPGTADGPSTLPVAPVLLRDGLGTLLAPVSGRFRRFRADFRLAKWRPGMGSALGGPVFSSPGRRFESCLRSSVGPPAPQQVPNHPRSQPRAPVRFADVRGPPDPRRRSANQQPSTSTTALAKACGASCGRLCPTPPVISRCAYLPTNFAA